MRAPNKPFLPANKRNTSMNSVTTLWTIWFARYWILVSVIVACVAATGAAFVGGG